MLDVGDGGIVVGHIAAKIVHTPIMQLESGAVMPAPPLKCVILHTVPVFHKMLSAKCIVQRPECQRRWQLSKHSTAPSMLWWTRARLPRWMCFCGKFLMAFRVAWMRNESLNVCVHVHGLKDNKSLNEPFRLFFFCFYCVPLSHVARCHCEFGCRRAR